MPLPAGSGPRRGTPLEPPAQPAPRARPDEARRRSQARCASREIEEKVHAPVREDAVIGRSLAVAGQCPVTRDVRSKSGARRELCVRRRRDHRPSVCHAPSSGSAVARPRDAAKVSRGRGRRARAGCRRVGPAIDVRGAVARIRRARATARGVGRARRRRGRSSSVIACGEPNQHRSEGENDRAHGYLRGAETGPFRLV